MILAPAQRKNPILRSARFLNKKHFDHAAQLFDHANVQAWEAAGMPDDSPGSQWWEWETEALRHIERWL